MKKISKKRLVILIVLILIVIAEIKIFTDSRANKLVEITANVVDSSGLLKDEKYIIQATSEKDSGYCITLPSTINGKMISRYLVEEKEITEKEQKEETTNKENVTVENNIVQEEKSENQKVNKKQEEKTNKVEQNNEIKQNKEQEESKNQEKEENQAERMPGEKLYLTATELEQKEITLKVEYETKKINEQLLYDKLLEQEVENNKIEIMGYMPADSQIKVEVVNKEEINELAMQNGSSSASLKVVYDIKIISEEKEYEPTDFDENVKVTIKGLDQVDTKKQKYKVVHIKGDNTTEEIENVETKEDSVTFETNHFSTYAVMLEDVASEETATALADEPVTYAIGETFSSTADVWDGSVASGFSQGEGTRGKTLFNYISSRACIFSATSK